MKAQEIALAVAAIIVLTFVHQLVHESQKLVDLSQPLSHSKDEGRPKVREEDDPNFFVQQLVHESQKLVDLSQPLSHSKDEGRPKVHEELVQKYGSASTKEAEPNFLQRNLAISSFKLREVVVPGHWDTTLLVIAFNDAPCVGYYRAKGTMARLAEMYGQDWKHIAFYAGEPRIGGSHPEGTTCIIDTVPHGHQFIQMSNRNSEGAQLNHRFLLDAFERFPDFTGYFMIGDDVLIAEAGFRQMDKNRIWLHSYPRALWDPHHPQNVGGNLQKPRWGKLINANNNMSLAHKRHIEALMQSGMGASVRRLFDAKQATSYDWVPLAGQGADLAYIPKRCASQYRDFVVGLGLEYVFSELHILWALLAVADEPVQYARGMIVPSAKYGKRKWVKHWHPEMDYFHPIAQHGEKKNPERKALKFVAEAHWPEISWRYSLTRGSGARVLPRECLSWSVRAPTGNACLYRI